jgi:uncharacterized membrane protein YqjE
MSDRDSSLDLLRRAVDDGGQLVQKEIQLAKQELTESVKAAVMAVVGGIAVLLLLVGFLVMTIVTVVLAVSPHWAAALAITVVFLLAAVGAGVFAITRAKRISPLRQTRETISEDVQWAKRQLTPDAK